MVSQCHFFFNANGNCFYAHLAILGRACGSPMIAMDYTQNLFFVGRIPVAVYPCFYIPNLLRVNAFGQVWTLFTSGNFFHLLRNFFRLMRPFIVIGTLRPSIVKKSFLSSPREVSFYSVRRFLSVIKHLNEEDGSALPKQMGAKTV